MNLLYQKLKDDGQFRKTLGRGEGSRMNYP